ncbi:MAG: hypothetical protein NXI31_11035 [bacterium]|nr:hypothetical protein [bacterium]
MAIRWILAPAACAGLGACALAPTPADSRARDGDGTVAIELQRVLALPVDEAACLTAHALRLTLRLADPMPYAGGAPATRLDAESFEIGYDRRGAQWLPAARHRLVDRGPGRGVLLQATDELPGYGVRAVAKIRLRVTAAGSARAVLTGSLPRAAGSRFEAMLTSALVARSAPGPAERAANLAREFASAGDLLRARHHRDHALLACEDPVQRARLAADLEMPGSARAARSSAKERIGRGDLAAARALQQTAARKARSPAHDYHLLWQLHRRADNADSAFAAALLLREHDRFGHGEKLAILELQAQGLADLVERALALDPQYLSRQGIEALPAAAPPR